MKRVYITVFLTCSAVLAVLFLLLRKWENPAVSEVLKIGFIYENDESGPFTYNFSLAQTALEEAYQEKIEILAKNNVLDTEVEEPLRDLVRKGCRIVFTNGHSDKLRELASRFPDVEICQVTYFDPSTVSLPPNYHTFKGKSCQGRYVSGAAAGWKLRELIENGTLAYEDAKAGFVAAFRTPEIVSGYTAFLLGLRSVVPQAVMSVKYVQSWNSYNREKNAARKLIEEGCVVVSHHTDSMGTALACEEEAGEGTPVIFVGFNGTMADVAPTTALTGFRTNWIPYVMGAVEAVLQGEPIEKMVKGKINGTDVCGGLEEGWIEMLDVNSHIAAPGTEAAIEEAAASVAKDRKEIYRGDYVGVDMDHPEETYDLKKGYQENENSSMPTFHYILKGIVTEE